jgi:hypothetical protein
MASWSDSSHDILLRRYEWFSESQILSLEMPTAIHEVAPVWLADATRQISEKISEIGLCGRPSVCGGGSSRVQLLSGSFKDPDASFRVRYESRGGMWKYVQKTRAEVILEANHSQTWDSVQKKAWDYLYKSENQVRAVIICNVPYPIPKEHNLQVHISVWVREPTDDISKHSGESPIHAHELPVGTDLPLQKCFHRASWGLHPKGVRRFSESDDETSLSDLSSPISAGQEGGSTTWDPNESTLVHDTIFNRTYSPGPGEEKILRRTEQIVRVS